MNNQKKKNGARSLSSNALTVKIKIKTELPKPNQKFSSLSQSFALCLLINENIVGRWK